MNAPSPPPRCTFVTGATGPGRSRWVEAFVNELRAAAPTTGGAVLLAETGFAGARQFAKRVPGVEVRWLALPCQCCPWLADLPRVARACAEASGAAWVVIDVPPLAAAGLLAEFDRVLGWPREVVAWLNAEWARARREEKLSPFQANLLALAGRVVEEPSPAVPTGPDTAAPELSLFPPSPS